MQPGLVLVTREGGGDVCVPCTCEAGTVSQIRYILGQLANPSSDRIKYRPCALYYRPEWMAETGCKTLCQPKRRRWCMDAPRLGVERLREDARKEGLL